MRLPFGVVLLTDCCLSLGLLIYVFNSNFSIYGKFSNFPSFSYFFPKVLALVELGFAVYIKTTYLHCKNNFSFNKELFLRFLFSKLVDSSVLLLVRGFERFLQEAGGVLLLHKLPLRQLVSEQA